MNSTIVFSLLVIRTYFCITVVSNTWNAFIHFRMLDLWILNVILKYYISVMKKCLFLTFKNSRRCTSTCPAPSIQCASPVLRSCDIGMSRKILPCWENKHGCPHMSDKQLSKSDLLTSLECSIIHCTSTKVNVSRVCHLLGNAGIAKLQIKT